MNTYLRPSLLSNTYENMDVKVGGANAGTMLLTSRVPLDPVLIDSLHVTWPELEGVQRDGTPADVPPVLWLRG